LALLVGLLAWLIVGGVVILDSLTGQPTPTLLSTLTSTAPPVSGTATAAIAERASLVPTVTPTDMPTASPAPTSTNTQAPTTPTLLPQFIFPPPESATIVAAVPTVGPTSITPTTAAVVTSPPLANGCTPPPGWVAYRVQPGDTLFGFQLGADGQVDVQTLMKGNCLKSNLLLIGQVLYLPPGVAEKSPKVDDTGPVDAPSGSRPANCPCTIRVREGWRLEQIAASIDKIPAKFSGRDFLAVTAPGAAVPDHWFLSSRPAGKSLEGFMFPGEYTIDNAVDAAQFRDMLLAAFAANVNQGLQGEVAAHGLTLWQAVNMASIIQRESYDANEQKMIASVIYNRMAKGMGIASFITLQYYLGGPGNWWPTITGANINTDTRYNTSLYKGLPPSPIDNPGLNAILAVAQPAQTDYLYVSAKCGGGGSFYARTWEEFQKGLDCSGK
jgi:LysM repeat protein